MPAENLTLVLGLCPDLDFVLQPDTVDQTLIQILNYEPI